MRKGGRGREREGEGGKKGGGREEEGTDGRTDGRRRKGRMDRGTEVSRKSRGSKKYQRMAKMNFLPIHHCGALRSVLIAFPPSGLVCQEGEGKLSPGHGNSNLCCMLH